MTTATTPSTDNTATISGGFFDRARQIIEAHPLATVIIAASIFRLIAIIWSKGFIHSDDHYDTVAVAYDWIKTGLFGPDGWVHWQEQPRIASTRFPLYPFSLFWTMKAFTWFGVQSLDTMMYGVRTVHAALSMIPVVVTYSIVRRFTGNIRWAVFGGLFAALHFLAPFLGVHCLIETVGGEIWMAAIHGFYRYRETKLARWLWFAGVMTGLAWMIRFQIAFAVLPIPFILWYEDKSLRGAVHYSLSVGAMILIAWVTDWILKGEFAGTTLVYLKASVDLDALYSTIPALYPAILLAAFVPPLSLLLFWQATKWSFVKNHLILVAGFWAFLLGHWSLANQQERFIFPMIPVCILMFVLALWHRKQSKGYVVGNSAWLRGLVGVSLAINAVLLVFLSVGYGHKGLIEPVVDIDSASPNSRVLYLQPEMRPWIAKEYATSDLRAEYVKNWHEYAGMRLLGGEEFAFDYFVVYPTKEVPLTECMDSLTARYGKLDLWREYPASWYDQTLHLLNPRHNDNFAAHVYRPAILTQ